MVSDPRKLAIVALAALAGACATPPASRWSVADLFAGPADADVYGDYIAARYASLVGDPVEAAAYYRKAAMRAPDDASALESAAFASLISGDVPAAVDLSRRANSRTLAGAPSAQLTLLVEDIAQGREQRALARLRNGGRGVAQGAGLGLINTDLATFLQAWLMASVDGDVDGAVELLKAPLPRRSSGVEAIYLQGIILASAGRDAEALGRFDEAWALQANAPQYAVGLHAQLLAATGDTAAARDVLTRRVGLADVAAPILARISAGQPVAPPRLTRSQGAAAAIYLASTSGLARSSPHVMTLRLSLALHLDPELAPARIMLAEALDDQQRGAEAAAMLDRVAQPSPYYATARMLAARINQSIDANDAAVAAAAEAVAASRRRDVLLGAADIYRASERYAEAESLYTEALRIDEAEGRRDWRPIYARATVRERLGRWAEAEEDAMRALELDTHSPELLNFLGYAWVDRGLRVEQGMELIRRAAAASPGQGHILDSLGWAHFRLGEFDKAVEHLEQAATLSPGEPEIRHHLADAYWRAGRRLEAVYEWRAALALAPDAPDAAELRAKIDNGLPDAAPRTLAEAPGRLQ